MRGGTANCTVIISGEEIGSPYTTAPGILIAMNEPSVDKFQGITKADGIIILNSSIIPADKPIAAVRTVCRVPATDIANSLQNPRGANIVMLGALLKASGIFKKEDFIKTIEGYFTKKGYHNPKNIECFNKGYKAV
jgi:2-oxoglutarate ferredoxin oxidoreductase subunit gamma